MMVWGSIVIAQCVLMIELGLELHLDKVDPMEMDQVRTDCCLSNGIVCDVEGRVTQIYWTDMGLYGVISPLNIPDNGVLTDLNLFGNKISGVIPSLPSSLVRIDLSSNRFNGSIPKLPPNLLSLSLYQNELSGVVPVLPKSLYYLALSHSEYTDGPQNTIGGNVTLVQPYVVFIQNNDISNVIIYDTSVLSNCDISDNPLMGNPSITNLTMCMQFNLYFIGNKPQSSVLTSTSMRTVQSTLYSTYYTNDNSMESTTSVESTVQSTSTDFVDEIELTTTTTSVDVSSRLPKVITSSIDMYTSYLVSLKQNSSSVVPNILLTRRPVATTASTMNKIVSTSMPTRTTLKALSKTTEYNQTSMLITINSDMDIHVTVNSFGIIKILVDFGFLWYLAVKVLRRKKVTKRATYFSSFDKFTV